MGLGAVVAFSQACDLVDRLHCLEPGLPLERFPGSPENIAHGLV